MARGALREILASFGVTVDDHQLTHASEKIEHFIEGLKKVGAVLLGGELVKGVFEFGEHLAEMGENIERSAVKLGISTDSYQQLGFAASQSAVGIEEMTASLSMLENKAGEALKGGEGAKNFQRLGIHIKDANGVVKDADTLFEEAADKISKMGNNAEKSAAATELFGRSGRTLLPILNKGAEGIQELRKEAEELGGGFSEAAVKASKEYVESLKKAEFVGTSLKGKIATALLPVLQKLVDAATKVGVWLNKVASTSKFVESTLLVLGSIVAFFAAKAVIAMAPVIAPFLFWALIIAGIILIVQDLWVLFRGGKSAIGDLIDSFTHAGQAAEWVHDIKDAWKGVSEWIHTIIVDLRQFLSLVDDALNKVAELAGMSRAASKPQTTEQIREAQRVDAVKHGRTVRFPGESKEESTAQLDRVRKGLIKSGELDAEGNPVARKAPPKKAKETTDLAGQGPVSQVLYNTNSNVDWQMPSFGQPASSQTVNHSPTTNVTINAANADANEVAQIFHRERRKANQIAAQDLGQIAEPAR